MKKLALLILAVAVLAGVGWYWKQSQSPASPKLAASAPAPAAKGKGALPVRIATVRSGPVSEEINAVGSLIANESIMIRPEVDGRIAEISFREGQLVRQGDSLLTIDASEVEAQLAGVNAALSLNRSRLKRAEELHQKNFISAQALDEARENLNQSVARQAEIQARLDKTRIRAPFEGVAGLRQVSPGAYVKAGQDIARLEGIGTLKVDFRVPENFLRRIRAGQQARFLVDAWPGETFAGVIYAVEPSVDEQTRTVMLRARLPNPGVRLKPGMFARVNLVLETRPKALLVPEQALVPVTNETYVFRVVDGKAVRTRVETGLRQPGEVEIVKGLEVDETVVVDGQLRLQDGAAVTVMKEKLK